MIELLKSAAANGSVRQLLRYGLVGIATNLFGYLLFLLITSCGIEPKKTMTGLYFTGAFLGFFGHRQWTFAHEEGVFSSASLYIFAHICGYAINFFILFFFVDLFGYSPKVVQAAAIAVVAGFLFITFKYVVFPNKTSHGE
jgi:putative flippase GtrA